MHDATPTENLLAELLAYLYMPTTRPWSIKNSAAVAAALNEARLDVVALEMHRRQLSASDFRNFEQLGTPKLDRSGRFATSLAARRVDPETAARGARIAKEIAVHLAEINERLHLLANAGEGAEDSHEQPRPPTLSYAGHAVEWVALPTVPVDP